MTPRNAAMSREDWTALILGMTVLFCLVTRMLPTLLVGFPVNDGGMFLVMIRDLRANSFVLPAYTSYNLANIPFAYPPFGFYIGALLGSLGIPELELLRWLPVLFNLLSILAFFLLAKVILKDGLWAAVGTLIYGMVPDSFAWQIMGGGLTRAPGMLFLLLAQYHVIQMFQKGNWRYAWFATGFCSLSILSHPEAGLAAASSCGLFWLFYGRSRGGVLRAFIVAGGTLLLTAAWWGSVLGMHGPAPFQNVIHSGAYGGNALRNFVGILLPLDPWTGLFHVLLSAGLIWNLCQRRLLLPLWLILPYVVEPRSAPAYAYMPGVILAAQALVELLPAIYTAIRRRRGLEVVRADFFELKGPMALIPALGLLWFIQGGLYAFPLRNTSLLPPLPQQAMTWMKENTPRGSESILLTGNGDAMTDPLQEWFPALALRKSSTTLQGQEWLLGAGFFPRRDQLAALQACTRAQCLEDWSNNTSLKYTHIFLKRNPGTEAVLSSLRADPRYTLIYENEAYVIFRR